MRITIMQPYFIPYPGYFRLFSASDLFVVYDCVQFPRRSRVHRNQLLNDKNDLEWLTVPLQKQPMETLIKDLYFRENSQKAWLEQLMRFKALNEVKNRFPKLFELITDISLPPVAYLVKILEEICFMLNIPINVAYSSAIQLPTSLKGQDRIIAIAKHFNATCYINSPGGRALYNEVNFRENNLELKFLTPYEGSFSSIIQCLVDMPLDHLSQSIIKQSIC